MKFLKILFLLYLFDVSVLLSMDKDLPAAVGGGVRPLALSANPDAPSRDSNTRLSLALSSETVASHSLDTVFSSFSGLTIASEDRKINRLSLALQASDIQDLIEKESARCSLNRSSSPTTTQLLFIEQFDPFEALSCYKLGLEQYNQAKKLTEVNKKNANLCAAFDAFYFACTRGYFGAYEPLCSCYKDLESFITNIEKKFRLKNDPLKDRQTKFREIQLGFDEFVRRFKVRTIPSSIISSSVGNLSNAAVVDYTKQVAVAVHMHALTMEMLQRYKEAQARLLVATMLCASNTFVAYKKLNGGNPLEKKGLAELQKVLILEAFTLSKEQQQFVESKNKELSNGVGPARVLLFTSRFSETDVKPEEFEQELKAGLKNLGEFPLLTQDGQQNTELGIGSRIFKKSTSSLVLQRIVNGLIYRQADQHLKENKIAQALVEYQKAFNEEKNIYAALDLAELYCSQKAGKEISFTKSLEHLTQFIRLEPRDHSLERDHLRRIQGVFEKLKESSDNSIRSKALCSYILFIINDERVQKNNEFYKELISLIHQAHFTLFQVPSTERDLWITSGVAAALQKLKMESGNYDLMFTELSHNILRFLHDKNHLIDDDISNLLLYLQKIIKTEDGVNQSVKSIDSSVLTNFIKQLKNLAECKALTPEQAGKFKTAYALFILVGSMNHRYLEIDERQSIECYTILRHNAHRGEYYALFLYPWLRRNCHQKLPRIIPDISETDFLGYFKKAADKNNTKARFYVAESDCCTNRRTEALAHIEALHQQGNLDEYYLKGLYCYNGTSDEKNKAESEFRQSIEYQTRILESSAYLLKLALDQLSNNTSILKTSIFYAGDQLSKQLSALIESDMLPGKKKKKIRRLRQIEQRLTLLALLEKHQEKIDELRDGYGMEKAKLQSLSSQIKYVLEQN